MVITSYYATGSTASGYISLLENNLKGLKKIIFIKGVIDLAPFYDEIINLWQAENNNLECIVSPFDKECFEAIINRAKGIAVVFDIHENQEDNLKAFDNIETVDFGKAIDTSKLNEDKELILQYKDASQNCLKNAYSFFNKALRIHDEWEKVYIDSMDFDRADALAEELICKIISNKKLNKVATIKHRFLGAATPEGAKDSIPSISQEIAKRYFVKGRPGTGKSTLLKKIAKAAENSGFDIEMYHCGFDYNSIDMVVAKELGVCIFDSSSPHEHFPSRDSDEIVDIYHKTVSLDIDKIYQNKLTDIASQYKTNIKIANSFLATMKAIKNISNEYYNRCVNFGEFYKIIGKVLKGL